jgi:hypothetical protein
LRGYYVELAVSWRSALTKAALDMSQLDRLCFVT